MTRGQSWLVHTAALAAAGTGIVYAVMRYLLEPPDQWAVVNHPWQPHVQHLHVLGGPLLIFAVAYIWREHAATRLGRPGSRGRWLGRSMMLLFPPMAATGLFFQISVDEGWRDLWATAHLVLGLVWTLVAGLHFAAARVGEPEPVDTALAPVGEVNWEPALASQQHRAADSNERRSAHDAFEPPRGPRDDAPSSPTS